MALDAEGWSRALTGGVASVSALALAPGDAVGERYEILQLLGEGGMGTVYKARDRELNRVVALKIIRPDLAGQPKILERFKQEIILARQVTHKNVIRIFDLGSAGPLKFITMEFVEGRDLSVLLRERKFAVGESIQIVRQVCRALDAAHSESVVHRDLKPQNIMVNDRGKVWVMDFGLAFSTELSGLTQPGAILGTPAYMSPEQAQGQPVDARSDLYTLGIIFYEMLAGADPFPAESMIASLLKRLQGPPPDPAAANPAVPKAVSEIVLKCLAADPAGRYQSAGEMLHDLDAVSGGAATLPASAPAISRLDTASIAVPRRRARWKWGGAAGLLLVLALAAGVMLHDRLLVKPGPHKPVSVLVADFANQTADPIFDGTLEPMFNVALEGASFINAFSRGDARRLAGQLSHPTDKLDEQTARLIAVGQGVNAVVSGSLRRNGAGYQLSVTARDAVTGNPVAGAEVSASGKDDVLLAVPRLAARIRKALGDTTPESVQLAAARGTLTASSLEAVHQYGVAMEQQFAGKMEPALESFSQAAKLDPNFARAYSGMAAVAGNLGQMADAERYIKLAMEHVDRMTERERYRTRGLYYSRIGNWQKCIEEYGELVSRYPADNIGHNNLANCYSQIRNMPEAVAEARQAVDMYPKAATKRLNLSLFSSYGADFQTGEREARVVQQLNPSYEKGYLALAFAQQGQGQLSQAAETYQKLEKVGALGASFAASGLADLALYEGRFADAVRILEKGAAGDLAARRPARAADKFARVAYVELLREQKKAAQTAAEKALANSQALRIRFLVAPVLVETGDTARARALAAGLASGLQPEPQAYARLIQGEIALQEKDARRAIQECTQANTLLDTWMGHFELGRAYLAAGLFVEADSEFDRCLQRRGEVLSLFLDEVPTYGYFPPVYYYQGRVREGLKSAGAAESYRRYLGIRGKAGEDPLLAEVRRRLGH